MFGGGSLTIVEICPMYQGSVACARLGTSSISLASHPRTRQQPWGLPYCPAFYSRDHEEYFQAYENSRRLPVVLLR